ncbi:MAG TPA: cytochrome c biogenesis CcdA family protein [Clostridia bacterium]|nr:cytochrome c biogenesis CcdA family protein [Clostridia bacterium]
MNILIGSVFIAGLLSFFSPCTVPMIPVYIGILADGGDRVKKIGFISFSPRSMLRTMLFVLGISVSFVTMGFGAGALGALLYSPWFLRILGFIVILLGIKQMGLIRLGFLDKERKVQAKTDVSAYWGAFILGLTFSFGWTPCVGPVLGAVLGISSSGGPLIGGFYMLIYSLGMMIPFLFITLFSSYALSKVEFLERHVFTLQKVGGLLIILMGILLMFDKLSVLSSF